MLAPPRGHVLASRGRGPAELQERFLAVVRFGAGSSTPDWESLSAARNLLGSGPGPTRRSAGPLCASGHGALSSCRSAFSLGSAGFHLQDNLNLVFPQSCLLSFFFPLRFYLLFDGKRQSERGNKSRGEGEREADSRRAGSPRRGSVPAPWDHHLR